MSEYYSTLVAKVWNYAHVLRDAGVSYGDYIEQITCLLFLKMDEERSENLGHPSIVPKEHRWDKLRHLKGEALATAYAEALAALGRKDGLLGAIYQKARNTIEDPAKLQKIVQLIDDEEWLGLGVDVKGAIYEGLLERNAAEVKSGAGQYFTPRPLIDAIVEVVDPAPGKTVCDPACGTGGFLLSAYAHMKEKPEARNKAMAQKLRHKTFTGFDIVPGVVRLAAMNLYLHGIGEEDSPVHRADALLADPGVKWDYVLTNPPFGRKQSFKVFTDDGDIETEREDYQRPDFKVTTGNKQLNFLQHVMTILGEGGTAAVVVPDNVLFETGGGGRIRLRLLDDFDCHTLLRLPTGIFYKQGVKANVLFFDKKPGSPDPWTKHLWIYDFRTNQRFTLKERPLKREHLQEFVDVARLAERHARKETERFKRYGYDELIKRDKLNLDIFWLRDASQDDPENLPPPEEIAAEIAESLEAALARFRAVAARLASR
ncbi:MAG TPA: class I SAM-dependent DNA methyltransferase [Stellaceae bacterium]|nr:class I SAM-dependent DNA methyltransferase [Stellaceae bacterium]